MNINEDNPQDDSKPMVSWTTTLKLPEKEKEGEGNPITQ